MNSPFSEFDELRRLLEALCDETASAEQMRRLEELVLAHPEAEAYYVQWMALHADLIGHFGALPARVEQSLRERMETKCPAETEDLRSLTLPARHDGPAAPVESSRIRSRRHFYVPALLVAGAAAAILLAVANWPTPSDVFVPTPGTPEPTHNTVAVVLQAPGAVWEEESKHVRAGAPLDPGWLKLKSGFAQIEFYSGATVFLEGPAELKLISRLEAYCARGKLRAFVPQQAHGFTIGSPKLDLVDRGTEFGLNVGADRTEVHVFDGKVELYDAGSKRQAPPAKELITGQGLRVDGPGKTKAIASNPADFRTARDLAAVSKKALQRHHEAWLMASGVLRKDPSLLVYYPFQEDEPDARTLLDAAGGRKAPHDGVLVGCFWGQGRWSLRQGLEFKRVSDRVRIHVPGDFESITLMTWVRIDALPNRNNSLMMADGWEEGELHWQIGDTGTVILGVQSRPKSKGAHYHAVEAISPERFGQWTHLAVVYDQENASVTHYVDGQPVAHEPIQFEIPLRIGDGELGNWNMATHRGTFSAGYPIRYFTGAMDEFMLFSRALSEQEVERIYDEGKPPL